MSQLAMDSEQLPVEWRVEQLKDVLQKTSSIDPRKSPSEEFEYIDVSSVSRATFSIDKTTRLKGVDAPSRARRHVKAGDVLFATIRPTLQRVTIVPDYLDGQVCSTGYFVLRPIPEINERFLYYYMFTEPFMSEMERKQKGASYPAVNDGDVREQVITFPPIPEQKRIVAILDEAFAGISQAVANAEKNLANARELFESYLNNIFTQKGDGWVEKRLEDLCVIGDGNHSSKYPKKSEMVESGVPFIRGTNLVEGKVSAENMRYISEEKHRMLKKGHLKTGDVLFTNRGEIGKVAIVDDQFEGANLNSQIAWLRCCPELLPEYLFFFLQSGQMIRHFSQTKSGAALQQFTIRMIKAVLVSYPLQAEQKKVINTLSELRRKIKQLESLYEKKQGVLIELKQSMLQKVFAGELTADTPKEW